MLLLQRVWVQSLVQEQTKKKNIYIYIYNIYVCVCLSIYIHIYTLYTNFATEPFWIAVLSSGTSYDGGKAGKPLKHA